MRLENAILPQEVTDFTTKQLVKKVQMFFRLKYNATVERGRLHRRIQQKNENVQAYADALKQIAVNCSFSGVEYDYRLRDTVVAGIRDDSILQKIV